MDRKLKYKCVAFLHNAVNKELLCAMCKNTLYTGSAGYANGYVAIPPEHPLFGKHYDYLEVDVHGGLTFSSPSSDIFEYFDTRAIELLDEEIPKGW